MAGVEGREQVDGQDQGAQGLFAEQVDGVVEAGHALGQPEKGRIDQPQDGGRHAGVLADDVGDARQGHVFPAQGLLQLRVASGQGRQGFQPGHHAAQGRVPEQPVQLEGFFQGLHEHFAAAGLAQVQMGRLDRLEHAFAVGIPRQDDPHALGLEALGLAQHLGPVQARHAHVGHDHVVGGLFQRFHSFPAAQGEVHVPLSALGPQGQAQAV